VSGKLFEIAYLGELKRLKKQAIELAVHAEALNAELQPESLRRDSDLGELLRHLIWDLDEASSQAQKVHKRVEILLAMQGHPLDSRDQYERDDI
jgi:hypothetical protein